METTEKDNRERELDVLMAWVSERLTSFADVPRLDDIVQYAYNTFGFRQLKRAAIARRLRLHPFYHMSSFQKRNTRRKNYRPIVTNTLGILHGDIGFYSLVREFETPVTFRSGFLILKDVLSRYLHVVILEKTRDANSIIRALKEVLKQHQKQYGPYGHRIKSIAFDREKSVTGTKVQNFLRDNNISFHAFKYTASKSKMAENAIRLIRSDMKKLSEATGKQGWWKLINQVVNIQNQKPIKINQKTLFRQNQVPWRPADVNINNLDQFLFDLQKADPVQQFGQFVIAPQLSMFKFPIGSIVRPKLIVTSSAVIGKKRSEISLEEDPFIVKEHISYVNAGFAVGIAYRCVNQRTLEEEIFDEQDLAESFVF